jgi:hypothetical protein
MTGLALWLNDVRWMLNMRRARRFRRELSKEQRDLFDSVFFSYPAACYNITIDRFLSAMRMAWTMKQK